MKNIVFDLGGVVVDWNPERLMQEYPGDPEMPLMLFKKGFLPAIGRILTGERQISGKRSAG